MSASGSSVCSYRAACALLTALFLGACSSSDSSSNGGGAAQRGCEDVAAAFATNAASCGYNYQVNYDAFVDAATRGNGCEGVVSLRDETELREECIPWFEALTCAEIADPNIMLLPACAGQLQV